MWVIDEKSLGQTSGAGNPRHACPIAGSGLFDTYSTQKEASALI